MGLGTGPLVEQANVLEDERLRRDYRLTKTSLSTEFFCAIGRSHAAGEGAGRQLSVSRLGRKCSSVNLDLVFTYVNGQIGSIISDDLTQALLMYFPDMLRIACPSRLRLHWRKIDTNKPASRLTIFNSHRCWRTGWRTMALPLLSAVKPDERCHFFFRTVLGLRSEFIRRNEASSFRRGILIS